MLTTYATQSATIRQASPTTPDADSQFMSVDGTGGAVVRALIDLERTVEVGDLATAFDVYLVITLSSALGSGLHTFSIEMPESGWDATTVDFATQPTTRVAPIVTAEVTGPLPADTQISIDITALLAFSLADNDDTGSRWYGVQVSVDTAGEKIFYSAYADPDLRPFMTLEPVYPPEAADNLKPSGGRAVSKLKPTFVVDLPEVGTYITAVQVQVDDVEDFETPDYDSGKVAHSEPIFDSNNPPPGSAAFANLATGVSRWWRFRWWDKHDQESPWSDPVEFVVRPKGVLALTAPVITDGKIASSTPTITFNFTPNSTETQESLEIVVEKKVGDVWFEHYRVPQQVTTETAFTVPDTSALEWDVTYRIRVRVHDTFERDDLPGDRSFHEVVSAEFTVAEAA